MPDEKKCPAAASKSRFFLNLLMVALGAGGLYFLSVWVSVVYLVAFFAFFFVVMPMTACRYCYFRTDASLGEWKEEYLQQHSDNMKKWGTGIFFIWGIPVVGIIASLFVNFSIVAVICLVGFVAILSVLPVHLNRIICAHCAILEVCPLKQPRRQKE